MRERALVKAYEAMLDSSSASVYRQRADRLPVDDDAAATAAWVARLAPNAAPFVRGAALPAGKAGDARAEVPSEEARRKLAAGRPSKVKVPANKTLVLWVALVIAFLVAWQWLAGGAPHSPWNAYAMFVILVVGTGLWVWRGVRRQQRDAKRINDAVRLLGVGALPRAEDVLPVEAKTPIHRAQAAHVLAETALRKGDPNEALVQCDRAFVALAEGTQDGKLVAPVAPADGAVPAWDLQRLLATQRAFALAALGRADEAWAEIEWAKGLPNGHATFRVRLLACIHARDYEGAARAVEARDPDVALPARDEAVAELARFVGRPASRTAEGAARLRAELRRDRELGPWIDAMAGGLLGAFERAAAETEAGAPATSE